MRNQVFVLFLVVFSFCCFAGKPRYKLPLEVGYKYRINVEFGGKFYAGGSA